MPYQTRLTLIRLLILVPVVISGCAMVSEEDRVMMPTERVLTYEEQADLEPITGFGVPVSPSGAHARQCREYSERIQTYRTAATVSAGLTTAGLIVGLLSDNETVQKVAGAAAVSGTIGQASAATAAETTAERARELGCNLR